MCNNMASGSRARPLSEQICLKDLSKDKLPRTRSLHHSEKRTIYAKRNESLGAMDELLQCHLCLDRLVDPKMLPCQHTFCLECLRTLVGNQVDASFDCPSCKVTVQLTQPLENLPNNVYVMSILSIVESESSEVPLALTTKCVKCTTVTQSYHQCCVHCKLIFCMVCMSKHASELEQKFPGFLDQLKDSEERLLHKNEDLERRTVQLNESVRVGTESKIAELRRLEIKVLREIEELNTDAKDTSSMLREKIGELRVEIGSKPSNSNDSEKVKMYMHFHNEISQLLDEVSRFGETHAIFDANTFKLDEESEDVVDGNKYVGNALDSNVNLGLHYKRRVFQPKFIWTKCPKPAGIAISPWAQELVYIATTDSQEVFILNKATLKVVGRLTHEEMLCPWAVCFCEQRSEVFVSDKYGHCVHVFSSDNQYMRTILRKGNSLSEVMSPQGLAIDGKGRLIVCDSGNDRVLILDPETGEQLGAIGPIGNKTELSIPSDVAVSGSKIIIVDSGNNRVKIYGEDGEKLNEIGSMGVENGQFRGAEVVAVGPLGFIHVGDAGNRRIQIFDEDGNFVRSFIGTNPKTGKFKWVSGICVTPELDIIATDYRSKCLLIF
ncbi:PREDICTED: RING finger protein nhl-1-like [Nicrophorus vespilloides]|uniref:RING finger protein nhl-1-like n=1 Tax=Nicrophorus vespilloides TaxID=110193 RepID=A0ABM1MG15_NICVS|nr:PREDICTED: RING finger protein nhl-1-like [Nicrophorus vespilloides]